MNIVDVQRCRRSFHYVAFTYDTFIGILGLLSFSKCNDMILFYVHVST